jgi:hypothetical protein
LIDVAIPSDRNVIQKEAEKKLNNNNLSIEIQRMWNMKCSVMPVLPPIIIRAMNKWHLFFTLMMEAVHTCETWCT